MVGAQLLSGRGALCCGHQPKRERHRLSIQSSSLLLVSLLFYSHVSAFCVQLGLLLNVVVDHVSLHSMSHRMSCLALFLTAYHASMCAMSLDVCLNVAILLCHCFEQFLASSLSLLCSLGTVIYIAVHIYDSITLSVTLNVF